MTKMLLMLAALAVTGGCAQIQAKFDQQVQTIALPDVEAAQADAIAAGDADGAKCWAEVASYLKGLPTQATTPIPRVNGVASAIEAGRIASQQPIPALPPIPHSLHVACAVIQIDAQQLALKFGITGALLGKGATINSQLGAAKQLEQKLGVHP